ncbi:MAG: MgpA protein [Candidatus Magasanikbacteria bacterium GW2011_GWC2_37_14]|uniref:MgpA protein n=1 Tax=Candidatus Magasanikbacteria bacterium GW2011_GWC2_37_14 TaxID=1619046 RepID=A0A0G0GCD3_9BACT|nr:MAG: MgpA protein [Candidatus Magasanikbacteria bacterium GW2011_GWC2_37_14]
MERTAKQIHNLIINAQNIVLVPHQNPDGDALGSVSSFSYYLISLNKRHYIFCATPASSKLQTLPHLIEPNNSLEIWKTQPDLIIVLDSGDLKYAGIDQIISNLTHEYLIINIDHHNSNTNFGQHNLVIKNASATAEVLYHFYKYNNINIDKNMALSLLTGLITDTDNFTNGATNTSSLKIASELIHRGANFNFLKNWFIKDKSILALKLWGTVLSRLSKHEELDIVYTYLTKNDFNNLEINENEIEGIANFLNNLGEGRASLILKELSNKKIKGSLRTTNDNIDVSVIAKTLGGGGHKKASGFVLEGTLEEVLKKVWEAVAKSEKKK